MSERQIEMFWRCSSCTHRNLGRYQVCRGCGNPKDGSEQYEMPEDTASAVSVTGEALLRMATAGPNWRCAYCESDQRAFDGGCQNCGASALKDTRASEVEVPPPSVSTNGGKIEISSSGCMSLLLVSLLFFGGCVLLAMFARAMLTRPREPPRPPPSWTVREPPRPPPSWTKTFQVADVSWEHSVQVLRYRMVERWGFAEARPGGALDMKQQGTRHHHDERVLDGYETISTTERVQEGFNTETYETREACGEDCTTSPKRCKERCTSNQNGFATCKTTCTGGTEQCTTRYCSVTRERKIPRYVDKQHSRQEPRYRNVSREAPWFSWKQGEWSEDRVVRASGGTLKTRWPTDAELRPPKRLAKGEKERTTRRSMYRVIFTRADHEPVTYWPASLEEFQRFTPGSTHTLHEEYGKLSVISSPAPVSRPARGPSSKPANPR